MLPSALDKLLGQLGIYATWLSSIAYLQKQLHIFNIFTPRFFSVISRFLLHEALRTCLHIYSLQSSAFLKYQTSDFIVPEANLIPLLTFERVQFVKFHFHYSVFSRNTGLGTNILSINWSYFALSLVKKSILDWHL